jgi:DNA polymerase III epsilon subunit-like protein
MWAYAKQCPDVRGKHQIPLTDTWRNNGWKLETAAARESVKLEGAHRALVDATATAQVLDLMLMDRLMPKTEPENQSE